MADVTLRPNGVGSYSQLGPINDQPGWKCVDEVTPDEDGTYVMGLETGGAVDTYALPDPSHIGTITSVTVWVRTRTSGGPTLQAAILTHSTLYYSAVLPNDASYTDHSWATTVNPNTYAKWTWAEIDALEAGIYMWTIPKVDGFCTQVWVVVSYTIVSFKPRSMGFIIG